MTPTWSYGDAAHLLRRAAFGGSPAEIERAVASGCEQTVDALMERGTPGEERPPEMTFAGIVRWWVQRMLRTSRPLEERMTFFWHNHFATSIAVVKHPELMLQQNALFRAHALGNVRDLTTAVSRHPAMLLWLDNEVSRKEHPNENFGRELLELFTLGLNRYSEADVVGAAKALTGWTVTEDSAAARFAFNTGMHDAGAKTFLGRTGAWKGEDVINIALSERTHGRFLARKLFELFANDNPPDALVDRLAGLYLKEQGEVRPLVRAILTSPEMYSPRARWSKIKSPIDHAVIACRQLGIDADPSTVAEAMNAQGLMLFAPQDANGWGDGMTWINSWSLLIRLQFARAAAAAFDPVKLTAGERFENANDMIACYLRLLGPIDLAPAVRKRLAAYVAPGGVMPSSDALIPRQRGLVRLVLSLPEWQRN